MDEVSIKVDEIDWQPAEGYPPGTMQKPLYDGSVSGPRAILLKMDPGWTMETHAHVHTELHYVLEGRYESQGETFSAGSFRLIPKRTNHGPFTTPDGAVVLVIWFDDNR